MSSSNSSPNHSSTSPKHLMRSSENSGIKSALRTVQRGLLIVFAMAVCIGFIVYTTTHIKKRPSVKIMSLWMNPIDISPNITQISTNWTIKFEVKNSVNKDINYSEIQVSVLYIGFDSLSSVKVSPFLQRRSNRTAVLVATPSAVLPSSSRDQIGSAIRRDAKETGVVSFDVDFRLQYEYGNKMKNKNKKLGYVHFVCSNVAVRFPPGAMRDEFKRCPYRKIS